MKNIFFKYLDNILIVLLFLYFSFTYLPFAYSNIVLILVIAFFLFGLISKKTIFNPSKKFFLKYALITTPFLLTIVSVLISDNMESGVSYLRLRAPIVIIPLIFLTVFNNKGQLKKSAPIFLLLSLFALFYTAYNLVVLNPTAFYNLSTECSSQITIIQHPYFGILQLIAIIFTLEFIDYKKNKTLFLTLLFLFSIGVLISTSRISYLLYLIVAITYLIKLFSRKTAVIMFLFIGATLTTLIVTNDAIQNKFSRSFTFETSPRLRLWNNSYQVLKNSDYPFFGVGIGDYYVKKEDPYWLKGYTNDLKENYHGLIGYDSHSQYIEFLLLNGILGLFFVALLLYCLYIALRQRDFFVISLLLVISIFALTESILNRQYGVIIYSFLMPIILGLTQNKKQNKKNIFT